MLVLAVTIAMSILPGYGLLVHAPWLSAAERVACAGPLSAVVCGTAALGSFLTHSSEWIAIITSLLVGACGLVVALMRGTDMRLDARAKQVSLFWLLLAAEFLGVEALLPTFGGADWFADWWVQFHRALVYGNMVSVEDVARTCSNLQTHCVAPVYDGGILTTRPPLFNLLCGITTAIDAGHLAAYQIAAVVWSAVIAGPTLLVAQRRGMRTGAIAGCLLIMNPFVLHLAVYPWPKVLSAAFEVLAVYWLLRSRDTSEQPKPAVDWKITVSIFSAVMAAYVHTAAIVYLLAILVYLWATRRFDAPRLRGLAYGVAAAILLSAPWVIWGIHKYSVGDVFLSSPTTNAHQLAPGAWIDNKIGGLLYSFIPVPLLNAVQPQQLSSGLGRWLAVIAGQQFYFNTYTGAQGVVACVCIILWRRRGTYSRDAMIIAYSVGACALLGAILLEPAKMTDGKAMNSMAGAIVLGIVYLAGLVDTRHRARNLLFFVAIESAIADSLYASYLTFGPWRQNPNTLVLSDMHQRLLSDELGRAGVVIFTAGLLMAVFLAYRYMRDDAVAHCWRSAAEPLYTSTG